MTEDDRSEPTEMVRTCEPTHRETMAVVWLALIVQGLEAFVLLIGGPLLPLSLIVTSDSGSRVLEQCDQLGRK
jgi:hypothetical protein